MESVAGCSVAASVPGIVLLLAYMFVFIFHVLFAEARRCFEASGSMGCSATSYTSSAPAPSFSVGDGGYSVMHVGK